MSIPKQMVDDGQAFSSANGILVSFTLTGGLEPSEAILYDGTDATGTVLWGLKAATRETVSAPELNIPYNTGVYCNLFSNGTSGAKAYIARK